MRSATQKKVVKLDKLDQTKCQDPEHYRERLRAGHLRLLELQHRLKETGKSLVVVVEGPDAAGKGGAIKRIVERLDPRHLRVYSIVKPTAEEYGRNYLWRFWCKLPQRSEIAIFDRSWYGRLLVERVEGFATEVEWKRAYREIGEFERMLNDDGVVFVKFWLHISKDEQMNRFKKRKADPLKRWKMNEEDWRNRRKWDAYVKAAEEMFAKTSFSFAPWHVIPANYKWYARVKVLETVCATLERKLK